MSGRRARAARQAEGVVKAPKVGTPLALRRVPMIRDVGKLPHPSGRALRALAKRALITGESLDRKSKTPAKSADTTGRKG